MPSSSDPIVNEVRAARDAIAKKLDYDIERIARTMQEQQAKRDRPVGSCLPSAFRHTRRLCSKTNVRAALD
jgi:DNA topoisomerase VI subunit B